jgi:hypothetical protein
MEFDKAGWLNKRKEYQSMEMDEPKMFYSILQRVTAFSLISNRGKRFPQKEKNAS